MDEEYEVDQSENQSFFFQHRDSASFFYLSDIMYQIPWDRDIPQVLSTMLGSRVTKAYGSLFEGSFVLECSNKQRYVFGSEDIGQSETHIEVSINGRTYFDPYESSLPAIKSGGYSSGGIHVSQDLLVSHLGSIVNARMRYMKDVSRFPNRNREIRVYFDASDKQRTLTDVVYDALKRHTPVLSDSVLSTGDLTVFDSLKKDADSESGRDEKAVPPRVIKYRLEEGLLRDVCALISRFVQFERDVMIIRAFRKQCLTTALKPKEHLTEDELERSRLKDYRHITVIRRDFTRVVSTAQMSKSRRVIYG